MGRQHGSVGLKQKPKDSPKQGKQNQRNNDEAKYIPCSRGQHHYYFLTFGFPLGVFASIPKSSTSKAKAAPPGMTGGEPRSP